MTNICHRFNWTVFARVICCFFKGKIAKNADENSNESYYFSGTSVKTEVMCVCEYERHNERNLYADLEMGN